MRDIGLAFKVSRLAYKDTDPNGTSITGDMGGHALIHTTDHGRIVIAFRGTESLLDCLVNLIRFRATFEYVPKSRVHAGFLKQYKAMRLKILDRLPLMSNRITNILVTGHSLGGALATMFATEMAYIAPTIDVKCIVFASPRVGDRGFTRQIEWMRNLSILRINHTYDIIPYVPSFGFVHTPLLLYLCPSRRLAWYDFQKRHSVHEMYKTFVQNNTRNRSSMI
jgi:pimeloyl-ACP methyl ester carboxylesterase